MCVHTTKAPSHAEIPWYFRRQRFAGGSSVGLSCSRRAGNSIRNTVYIRPVGGGSVLSLLPLERVLRRYVRFDDGHRRFAWG
jgi:hypothetical protein